MSDYPQLDLADGEYLLPAGKIAMIVTHLEQLAPPERPEVAAPDGVTLEPWQNVDLDSYLELFRAIGTPWLWFGRLLKTRDEVSAIFARPGYSVFRAMRDGRAVGLLELDTQDHGDVEVAYFGLVPGETGRGNGRWLMDQAQRIAWAAEKAPAASGSTPAPPTIRQRPPFTRRWALSPLRAGWKSPMIHACWASIRSPPGPPPCRSSAKPPGSCDRNAATSHRRPPW